MANVLTIERTVEVLRKRYKNLLDSCGGSTRLAKRLSEFDTYFHESQGVYDVANAKRDRAGEAAMIRIISAMEKLAKKADKAQKKASKNHVIERYQPKYDTTKELQTKLKAHKKP